MKKYLLLICFLMFSSLASYSQNAIAKLKYEEAELAFSNNQFNEAIVKLDEAEKILGSTNPKILYLRIMSQKKIIENDPVKNYDLIAIAKENSIFYLKSYESYGEIDEKYREVYAINEYFLQLPPKEKLVEIQTLEQRKLDGDKVVDNILSNCIISAIPNIYFPEKIKLGMETSNLKESTFFKANFKYQANQGNLEFYATEYDYVGTYPELFIHLTIRNDSLVRIVVKKMKLKDDVAKEEFDFLLNNIKNSVGSENIKVTEEFRKPSFPLVHGRDNRFFVFPPESRSKLEAPLIEIICATEGKGKYGKFAWLFVTFYYNNLSAY